MSDTGSEDPNPSPTTGSSFKARPLPKHVKGKPQIPVHQKDPSKLRTPPVQPVPRLPKPHLATDVVESRAPKISPTPLQLANGVVVAPRTKRMGGTSPPVASTSTSSSPSSRGSPTNPKGSPSTSSSPRSLFPTSNLSSSPNYHHHHHSKTPIVTFRARNVGPKCPFSNPVVEFTLRPGGCVCLSGQSGLGKTTLATVLTGLQSNPKDYLSKTLDIALEKCVWSSSIPSVQERCGVLFQTTTLMDELTLAGNLHLALQQRKVLPNDKPGTKQQELLEIKQLLESVDLDYNRDANKRPTELSGGMGRRASLALQLAQHKRVIVADEPFTGLDYQAAMSVAKQLVHIRKTKGVALVLISHEPHLAQIVLDPKLGDNQIITLQPPSSHAKNALAKNAKHASSSPSLFGTNLWHRFLERWLDYTMYSMPLIVLAFCACGLAIGMLTADLLARLDFADDILKLVETHVKPLIQLLTGKEATGLQMMGVRFKVSGLLQETVPPAKAHIFAVGMTKLFCLEIGPLLTALLLCGRIGGSYAGQVGTLHATQQAKLLRTLGVSPVHWTLVPASMAAFLAAPLLTMVGTGVALALAGYVGPVVYGIGTTEQFRQDVLESLFPTWRLEVFRSAIITGQQDEWHQNVWELFQSRIVHVLSSLSNTALAVTYPPRYDPSWLESMIEIVTYPPVYHVVKSIVYMGIILGTAQVVTHLKHAHLTPRGVPSVITLSVVWAGLLVILADWGFSQLWLLRY